MESTLELKKNKPYLAFNPEEVIEITPDTWLVDEEDCRTLYDGRYCAVSGFFFAVVDGHYSVLAEKRGKGVPDFQGFWCCPCGFLERNENSKEGIRRETMEECGFEVKYEKIKIVGVETEPEKCNNGNVTIRHKAFLGKQEQGNWLERVGGEKDEVEEIMWIPVDKISDYKWAFGHLETISKLIPSKLIKTILEILYR